MKKQAAPAGHGGLLAGYAAALAGVAVITALIQWVPEAAHVANISMLYLLVVVGTSLRFGRGPAVAASLFAFLAFNWFFTEPRHTLTVRNPAEWLALFLFLFTAVVTSHLTGLLWAQADEARRRERETAALAEASWAVASRIDRDTALAEVLRRLAEVVEVRAAAIVLPREGNGGNELAGQTGEPVDLHLLGGELASLPANTEDDTYLPLRADHRLLGVLYVRFGHGRTATAPERRVIESLANLAAVILERDRLARSELQSRALAEADRLKTALLSMVSHDFRSPLASIRASATTLLQSGVSSDQETRRELLTGIDQEAERLNRMVGNILSLSRLEADAWRPQREATDPTELVGSALRPFSPDQNRRVQVRIMPGIEEAYLDPVQITQVIHNLVDNALKYSPLEEAVELAVTSDGERLLIQVSDRGVGLAPGEEDQVFERFYRSPRLRESALPGVGIGLAVCRGLVEAHGGRLTAHARSGGGTDFRVALPLGLPDGEGTR
jgi:two-component system sensor histidine kinase KdpD